MGAVAEALADFIVLTDDNPRSEDGDRIIEAISEGFTRLEIGGASLFIERDRSRAIALAVEAASADDVILVAGKGHETYQETSGVLRPFSDVAAARNALQGKRS
jgi:UDP-N-acetylmuramoyl-L-alanyl-D-glutamate--2,6-diaminopimelate ligase